MKKTNKAGLAIEIIYGFFGFILLVAAFFEFEVRYGKLLINDFFLYIAASLILSTLGSVLRMVMTIKTALEKSSQGQ